MNRYAEKVAHIVNKTYLALFYAKIQMPKGRELPSSVQDQ
ncbi:hypothetical protein IMCC3088_544 [Aequoribacter fuscus]|uniref:Uncharacterized protein n=1 Tax=Aequoribacter fuscus TaxID=2518989 RepID=F3KZV1_9GAMM|nr:hypothetical protein IMCC3088_544 [Aequoribacter fuscus]